MRLPHNVFHSSPNGTELKRGDYVSNEWAAWGLELSASGGCDNRPRLFDTGNPGGVGGVGDPDLGSPNMRYPPSGFGKESLASPTCLMD